jgi:hypothetical protein
MLIAVGIDAIISRKVEKITKAKLKEMANISKEIENLTRKLVNGELEPSISLSDFNWRTAIKELVAGWNVDQVVDMTKSFPREYQVTASALIIKSQDVIKQLSEGLPLAQYQTLSGLTNLIPADTHIFKFTSILEVVRNPLIIFSLMAAGALLRSQAHAVRTIYPTLSAAIDAAILQATITAKANKKSFELPPKAEYGIKAWYGQGPVSTKSLVQSQAAIARVNERKKASIQPPSNTPKTQSLLTSTQKIEEVTA